METRYIVKYPMLSAVIEKDDSGIFRPYDPKEIVASNWDSAHIALCAKARQRLENANQEVKASAEYLVKVLNMENPEERN